MTPISAHVLATIEELEANARMHATAAGEARDLAEQLRKAYRVPSLATPPAPTPAPPLPAETERPALARSAVAPPAAASSTPTIAPSTPDAPVDEAADEAADEALIATYQAQILDVLTRATAGGLLSREMRSGARTPVTDRELALWSTARSRLVTAGRVKTSGARAGMRYALPTAPVSTAATKAAPAAAIAVAGSARASKPAGPWPTTPLASAIRAALQTATCDRRELLAAVRKINPAWESADVEAVMRVLVPSGFVRKDTSGYADRYVLVVR